MTSALLEFLILARVAGFVLVGVGSWKAITYRTCIQLQSGERT
jgi:hypothetical protein